MYVVKLTNNIIKVNFRLNLVIKLSTWAQRIYVNVR